MSNIIKILKINTYKSTVWLDVLDLYTFTSILYFYKYIAGEKVVSDKVLHCLRIIENQP